MGVAEVAAYLEAIEIGRLEDCWHMDDVIHHALDDASALADAGFERTENAQQWGGEANGVGGGLVSWNGAWLCCCSLVGLTESTQESTCNCRAYSTWFRP